MIISPSEFPKQRIPVDFGWSDLGTWGSLYQKSAKEMNGNVTLSGDVIYRNSKNNIVKTQSRKKVVIQGISDSIIVEKDDVLLICPKDNEQDIKEISSEVRSKFGNKFI